MSLWGISVGIGTGVMLGFAVAASNTQPLIDEVSGDKVHCSVDVKNPENTSLIKTTTGEPLSAAVKVFDVRKGGHTVLVKGDLSGRSTFYINYEENGFYQDGEPSCVASNGQQKQKLYQVKPAL